MLLYAQLRGNNQGVIKLIGKGLPKNPNAKASGIGIVGTFNTSTSSGAIGYVASGIANQGLVGLVFASSPPRVATAGSFQPIFGTNLLEALRQAAG